MTTSRFKEAEMKIEEARMVCEGIGREMLGVLPRMDMLGHITVKGHLYYCHDDSFCTQFLKFATSQGVEAGERMDALIQDWYGGEKMFQEVKKELIEHAFKDLHLGANK